MVNMDNVKDCNNNSDSKKIPKEPELVADIGDKCSICQRPKADPVSAHCGHSFCWLCINEYLFCTRSNDKRRCPVCTMDMEAHVTGYGKQPKSNGAGNGSNGICSICQNPNYPVVANHYNQLYCYACFTELFVVKTEM